MAQITHTGGGQYFNSIVSLSLPNVVPFFPVHSCLSASQIIFYLVFPHPSNFKMGMTTLTQSVWEDMVREGVQARGMCLPLVFAKQHRNVHQWPKIYHTHSCYFSRQNVFLSCFLHAIMGKERLATCATFNRKVQTSVWIRWSKMFVGMKHQRVLGL